MRNLSRSPLAQLALTALVLAGALACASTEGEVPKEGVIGKPRSSNGFVPIAQVAGLVAAEAHCETNQDRLKVDLLDEVQVIPVFVKIGDRSRAGDELDVELTPEQMEFRLHLPDGTVLDAIPAEAVIKDEEEISARVIANALQPGFLRLAGGTKEGFVYFKLRPKDEFDVDGERLVHTVNHIRRELDVSRSLLSFKLRRGGLATSFFIGVAR